MFNIKLQAKFKIKKRALPINGKLSAAAVTGDNAVSHFTARTKIAFALRFSADRASDQIAKSAACNRA